ncbi:hypothetical protein L202_02829 [Cryptococcus amylolentus CBS 6039]|uniref:Uncharacterized protein n=2 Tax=Cryptococcus amylolentus TaxID=104669 RepID=A0A1E3HWG0_9TREE|nr:hypothetical protein L202_02829 [Cryptococcus amylolentus CBS 6039]ODN80649.1 hypothetical protein L202_02829 [Cryptococcus amylolentus CBS 6039]ODO09205.1 hypothetical protein I350_02805 [Cryptococcus amylolentus CBS 6273]
MSTKQIISSEKYPLKPHNSPAVKVPGLIFASGQVGTGDIETATKQSVAALKDVLELAGSSLSAIVKLNIFLADMNDMVAMNDVIVPLLPEGPKPARTCIQAGKLPGGPTARIEIEAIAQV